MRARLMAIFLLSASILGLSGGALLIPTLADFWPNDPRAHPRVEALAAPGPPMTTPRTC
jgi:hypothetical protein